MLNTTHFSVGLAIGRNVSSPEIAFLIGLASHFFMDWIPHWDGAEADLETRKISWKTKIAVARDLSLTAIVAWLAWRWGWIGWGIPHISTLAGITGAIFPDLMWIPYYLFGLSRPKRFFEFHHHIQHSAKPLPGLAPQIALIAISFWLAR